MAIEITKKAVSRVMSYMKLKEKPAEKLIGRAYVWGTDIRELPAKRKEYFESRVDTEKRRAYVYAGCCFIFADSYCVNVIKSPRQLFEKSAFDGKIRIRNPKKYFKYNGYSERNTSVQDVSPVYD